MQSAGQLSAKVGGRVLDADTGRPLAWARVAFEAAGAGGHVTTDDSGAYELAVEPRRYWIWAERHGYSRTYYGQSGPHEAPRSVYVGSGEVRRDIDILLAHPGAVAGRVVDHLGEPIEGATVIAAAADFHMARTNDLGEFRIARLEPGKYIVWAMPPHPSARTDQTLYLPTYVPGTSDRSAAFPIAVAPSTTAAVDIALLRGKPAEVEGVAFSRAGTPAPGAEVILTIGWAGARGGYAADVASTLSGADGTFVLRRVPPGRYRLTATAGKERAEADVTVHEEGLQGLVITTTPGTTVLGHLSIHGSGTRACRTPVITVGRFDPQSDERYGNRVRADERGRFLLEHLHGRQRLSVSCPEPAVVTRLIVNGRPVEGDVLDTAALGETADVQIVGAMSAGIAQGIVNDERGRPCDCGVLVVRDDPSTWLPSHHFLWTAWTTNGRFEFHALPPGDYFALVEPLGKSRWDPEYLRLARARGTAFRSDGHSQVDLTLTCR